MKEHGYIGKAGLSQLGWDWPGALDKTGHLGGDRPGSLDRTVWYCIGVTGQGRKTGWSTSWCDNQVGKLTLKKGEKLGNGKRQNQKKMGDNSMALEEI